MYSNSFVFIGFTSGLGDARGGCVGSANGLPEPFTAVNGSEALNLLGLSAVLSSLEFAATVVALAMGAVRKDCRKILVGWFCTVNNCNVLPEVLVAPIVAFLLFVVGITMVEAVMFAACSSTNKALTNNSAAHLSVSIVASIEGNKASRAVVFSLVCTALD